MRTPEVICSSVGTFLGREAIAFIRLSKDPCPKMVSEPLEARLQVCLDRENAKEPGCIILNPDSC
jgi:hypothetical protein